MNETHEGEQYAPVEEDQIVPQVRSRPTTLADNQNELLQGWQTTEQNDFHSHTTPDDLAMESPHDGGSMDYTQTVMSNSTPSSPDNLPEPITEDDIIPQTRKAPPAVDFVGLETVLMTERNGFEADVARPVTASSPAGRDVDEIVEAKIAPGRKSVRTNWMSETAGLSNEFAWMAVEVERTARHQSETSSLSENVEEEITVEAVQSVFRAPPRPPVVEETITPTKRPTVECSINFDKLEHKETAHEEMVVESPGNVVQCRPPSIAIRPVSVDTQQRDEVVEEPIGAAKVSARRLDDMLANCRIEFEPIDYTRTWSTPSSDEDSPIEETITVTEVSTQFSAPRQPLPPLVEEEIIVPERKPAIQFVPNFSGLMEVDDDEIVLHREMAVDVPGAEAEGEIALKGGVQVILPTAQVATAPAASTPPIAPPSPGKPDKKAKSDSSGGGVFGFLKRKPKNGSNGSKNGKDVDNDEEARKKSNSLGKQTPPEVKGEVRGAAAGGTFPMEAKKEKNGRGGHFGLNFGKGGSKEKNNASTQQQQQQPDLDNFPVDDDDEMENAKKTPSRPSSATGAKSPRKTNIRIFEIMASNGVETPAAAPAKQHAEPAAPSPVDATVFCPVGPPKASAASTSVSVPSASATASVVVPAASVSVSAGVSSPPQFVDAVDVAASPSGPTSTLPPYFVAVAIDFGTTFSGYAFSFTHDAHKDPATGRPVDGGSSVHMMGKWEGGDPGVVNQKTPSTLLLTPDGRFHSFGFTARNFYHDMTPEEADTWLYFDKFKMALYNATECNSETMIEAANGKKFSAFLAVAMTLNFFKQHALQELNAQCATRILDEDVRWVITVPAIWNAQAKQFMRMAAYEAGIASPDKADQLLIALEPEAASIHIRRLRMHQLVPDKPVRRPLSIRQDTELLDGIDLQRVASKFNQRVTRYMVVDCGGGTVDITVHELDAVTAKLQELHKAAGGPHGSCGIDREFERLLDVIFGAESMRLFRRRHPSGWICLMTAFESRKRAAGNPLKTTPLNIPLPFTFIDFYRKHTGSTVEQAISQHADRDIRWSSQGMLRMTQDAMKKLFLPTLDSIGQTVAAVLDHPRLKDVQYIFLVGGLSESPLIQQDMRQRFGTRAQVIVPQEASLAVLKGAVCFGLDQTVVSVRRSRYTYGAAVLKRFVRGRHPESKLMRSGGTDWCRDVFDPYVVVDEVVRVGDIVIRRYAPASPSQTYITIAIYSSASTSPAFTTDEGVSKCATIRLDLSNIGTPATGRQPVRVIETRMTFADTEIKVSAVDVTTGQRVNASMDFFNI